MMLAGLGCPAIAIVRHHLYDIDILINRTLVYVTLTATLVYFGGVAGLQRLLSPVLSSSCSSVRAPMIGAVTPPCLRSQLREIWA
jgi:hypothetical protein